MRGGSHLTSQAASQTPAAAQAAVARPFQPMPPSFEDRPRPGGVIGCVKVMNIATCRHAGWCECATQVWPFSSPARDSCGMYMMWELIAVHAGWSGRRGCSQVQQRAKCSKSCAAAAGRAEPVVPCVSASRGPLRAPDHHAHVYDVDPSTRGCRADRGPRAQPHVTFSHFSHDLERVFPEGRRRRLPVT